MRAFINPSMKVPPKRKGNAFRLEDYLPSLWPLNESPSEKEGKFQQSLRQLLESFTLNESPSEKEGKSMKYRIHIANIADTLNESPSEKEGKYHAET